MNTLRIALVFILALFSASFTANAGKNKGDDKEIIIKAWFKDGTVYEGPMPKHWHTYRQTFLNPGHNFHTVPSDGSKKTVKREAKDTDSQGAKRLPVIPKGFKGLQEACSACFGIQLRKSKNALGFTLSLNKDLG